MTVPGILELVRRVLQLNGGYYVVCVCVGVRWLMCIVPCALRSHRNRDIGMRDQHAVNSSCTVVIVKPVRVAGEYGPESLRALVIGLSKVLGGVA
jgi:hypothetical protein